LRLKIAKGQVTPFATDEHVRAKTTIEDLRKLKPVFQKQELSPPETLRGSLTVRPLSW
jgi:acetyl-CoA acetyltransferase